MKFLVGLACLVALVAGDYDDVLARTKMVPLMAGSYVGANGSSCFNKFFPRGEFIRYYSVKCESKLLDDCAAFTAVSHDDKAIILAFGGSTNFIQIIIEGSEAILDSKITFIGGGKVSEYFYRSWESLWNAGMRDDFLAAKNNNPGYSLWVTGHSLGGAMASVASAYVVKLGYFKGDQVLLYTAGQPRTGDKDYASAHDQLLGDNSFRVTHKADIVPHVAPEDLENYWHHRNEVWYNEADMKPGSGYMVCTQDESNQCSDSNLIDLNVLDHIFYFETFLYLYGVGGCQG